MLSVCEPLPRSATITEFTSCSTCIGACYRVLWYLQKEHVRLGTLGSACLVDAAHNGCADYHWQELWRALVLLLDFLASKLESLTTTGGVQQLAQEVSSSYTGKLLEVYQRMFLDAATRRFRSLPQRAAPTKPRRRERVCCASVSLPLKIQMLISSPVRGCALR